jgi:hypothetical protein
MAYGAMERQLCKNAQVLASALTMALRGSSVCKHVIARLDALLRTLAATKSHASRGRTPYCLGGDRPATFLRRPPVVRQKVETGKPSDCSAVVKHLQHWKVCPDLVPVRDNEARKKLPEAEQKEWQTLWEEVETLLKRAQEGEKADGKQ